MVEDPTALMSTPPARSREGRLLSRSQDIAGRLDRLEFAELYGHSYQRGEQVAYVGRSPHEAFFTPDGGRLA
jgi:hypothetical protein